MIKRTLMLATALMLTMTIGCTRVQQWMVGGAAIGAGTGAIWASHAMGALNIGEAAAVGAAGGAAVGALIGDMLTPKAAAAAPTGNLEEENRNLRAQLAARDQELAQARQRISELEKELADLRAKASVVESQIILGADVLFQPGSARLTAQGRQKLDEAASTLMSQHRGKFIMIEGHTDAQPIKHSNWKSNWELGAARALTVLHYLTDKGVDPAMLSAATFSKYQARASNDTPDGMAQNRRAVIVIYSQWKGSTTAGQAPAAAAPAPAAK